MRKIEIGSQTKGADSQIEEVKAMVQACIQCGTCSGSCPNEFAMDHTPRHLWRMVLMDHETEIFKSRTFSLCSSCYYCTLRCPRGLPLTEAMAALKQIAARKELHAYRKSSLFYASFMEKCAAPRSRARNGVHDPLFCKTETPTAALSICSPGVEIDPQGKGLASDSLQGY